jgi:hypothetical protein
MRKRNETRKFRKLRKGSKNYSTHMNKSGGGLGTFVRSLTSDGRLLEEFKSKIRNVPAFQLLLDDPDNTMLEKTRAITREADDPNVNTTLAYKSLKKFVDSNKVDLGRILNSSMTIKKKEFYNEVLNQVMITRHGVGAGAHTHADASNGAGYEGTPPLPPPGRPARSLPPTPASLPGPGMGDGGSEGEIITNSDGKKVYVNSSLPCGVNDQGENYLNDKNEPSYFTSDIGKDEDINNLRCKFCFKSKKIHIEQGQGGGSRRRRRNTRLRKNKTKRNGKCRACRCPGGCKRSTCPCYRGRSKPCCTKRCRSRGRVCRC